MADVQRLGVKLVDGNHSDRVAGRLSRQLIDVVPIGAHLVLAGQALANRRQFRRSIEFLIVV
jgi:hypothetical protein